MKKEKKQENIVIYRVIYSRGYLSNSAAFIPDIYIGAEGAWN